MNGHASPRFFIESWLQWQVVTGVTSAFALSLLPAVGILNTLAPFWYLRLFVSGFVLGMLLGLGQWFFLRLELESVWRWLLASSMGSVAALALMALILQIRVLSFEGVIGAALAGFLLGGCQSLALLPRRRRPSWVVGTVVGWSIAAAVAACFSPDLRLGVLTDAGINMLYSLAIGWVLLSLILSVGFVILSPASQEKDISQPVKWWP